MLCEYCWGEQQGYRYREGETRRRKPKAGEPHRAPHTNQLIQSRAGEAPFDSTFDHRILQVRVKERTNRVKNCYARIHFSGESDRNTVVFS